MTDEQFFKAKELVARQDSIKKAITTLKKASWTSLNMNGVITSDNKADHIKVGDEDHFLVEKSGDFFYKMRLSTIEFFKEELASLQKQFSEL